VYLRSQCQSYVHGSADTGTLFRALVGRKYFSQPILRLLLRNVESANCAKTAVWSVGLHFRYYRVGQKTGHRLIAIILSNRNRFTKNFSLEDSLVNLQLNGY